MGPQTQTWPLWLHGPRCHHGSAGHLDQYVPTCDSIALRHPHGFVWQPKQWTSEWPLVAAWAQTSSWPQELKQADIHLFLMVMAPVPPFSTVHKPLGFTVSPISPLRARSFPSLCHTFAYPGAANLRAQGRKGFSNYACIKSSLCNSTGYNEC